MTAPWPCDCRPHEARFTGDPRHHVLILVHGIDCDRPLENRRTITLRYWRQPLHTQRQAS